MLGFFTVLLTFLALSSAILMVIVILLQSNKGGGLGAVSGGLTETMFGASAANVLVKTTIWFAAIFMSSTLLLAALTGRVRSGKSIAETLIVEPAEPVADDSLLDLVPAETVEEKEVEATEATTEATEKIEAVEAEATE